MFNFSFYEISLLKICLKNYIESLDNDNPYKSQYEHLLSKLSEE